MTLTDAAPPALRSRLINGVVRNLARLRLTEPEVLGLTAVVRAGDRVMDVGAAYGMYTYPLACMVGPAGYVFSFEPQPKQRTVLRTINRLLQLRHVHVDGSALGAAAGKCGMLLPLRFGVPIHGHAHMAAGAAAATTAAARLLVVSVQTVDDWCQLWEIDSLSFMKVDVEGFELNVLAGAGQVIERCRPSMLLEIEERHTARYGHKAIEVAAHILRTWPEYRMYTWAKNSWRPAENVQRGTRNYLFATEAAFQRPA